MEKWKMIGSRRFVEVFGIEAFRRLGVRDPLFKDKLRTEREKRRPIIVYAGQVAHLETLAGVEGWKKAQAQLQQLIAWWRRLVRQRFKRIGE